MIFIFLNEIICFYLIKIIIHFETNSLTIILIFEDHSKLFTKCLNFVLFRFEDFSYFRINVMYLEVINVMYSINRHLLYLFT